MLVSRSPVFCAMFTGPAKDENSMIHIKDVDKDAFTQMLRWQTRTMDPISMFKHSNNANSTAQYLLFKIFIWF